MEPKLKRIINLLNEFDQFRACGPSDDLELHSIVCVDYHHLVTQLKVMATPYLPKYSSDLLNSVEVELDNIYSVYMASPVVSALLPDIREIVQDIDGLYFGPSKKDRILSALKEFDNFKLCSPNDDPEQQTASCAEYHHLVTQLQIMASPFIPKGIADPLNRLEVDLTNIFTAYEAREVIITILNYIKETIEGLEESAFDPAKVKSYVKPPVNETNKGRKQIIPENNPFEKGIELLSAVVQKIETHKGDDSSKFTNDIKLNATEFDLLKNNIWDAIEIGIVNTRDEYDAYEETMIHLGSIASAASLRINYAISQENMTLAVEYLECVYKVLNRELCFVENFLESWEKNVPFIQLDSARKALEYLYRKLSEVAEELWFWERHNASFNENSCELFWLALIEHLSFEVRLANSALKAVKGGVSVLGQTLCDIEIVLETLYDHIEEERFQFEERKEKSEKDVEKIKSVYGRSMYLRPKIENLASKVNLISFKIPYELKNTETNLAEKPGQPDIHLTEDQVELLNWFNDNHPLICKISHYSKRSDKTNRNNVKVLKELGLLEPPKDKKYGLVITEAGRKYIETHF